MLTRKRLGGAALLAAGLLTTPAYAHANYIAAGPDPKGDATDMSAARDIIVAALGYDRDTGTLRGGIALRGAPDDGSRAFVSVAAAVRTPSGCDGYPQILLSSFTTEPLAQWTRFDVAGTAAARGDLTKGEVDGELQKFEITDAQLAGSPVDCITAILADPANPRNVYDSAGPLDIEALPELGAKLGRTPASLQPGQKRTIRLTLRNPGDASTGTIRVKISRKRGLTAKVSKRVKALDPGERRTVRIRVSLSSHASSATPLRVTAAAGRLRVTQNATLYLRRSPKSGGGRSGSGVCAGYSPVLGGVGSIVAYPC